MPGERRQQPERSAPPPAAARCRGRVRRTAVSRAIGWARSSSVTSRALCTCIVPTTSAASGVTISAMSSSETTVVAPPPPKRISSSPASASDAARPISHRPRTASRSRRTEQPERDGHAAARSRGDRPATARRRARVWPGRWLILSSLTDPCHFAVAIGEKEHVVGQFLEFRQHVRRDQHRAARARARRGCDPSTRGSPADRGPAVGSSSMSSSGRKAKASTALIFWRVPPRKRTERPIECVAELERHRRARDQERSRSGRSVDECRAAVPARSGAPGSAPSAACTRWRRDTPVDPVEHPSGDGDRRRRRGAPGQAAA